jgi:thioredoxin reductase
MKLKASYDVVIVGSGAGGLTAAIAASSSGATLSSCITFGYLAGTRCALGS